MFKKLTNACVKLVNKYLPDPFIFAIILTIVTFIGGMGLTKQTPIAMARHWGGGFWSLLAFSMQMALVLVLGNAMAQAPVFKRLFESIALSVKTPGRAIVVTGLIATIACWLNWGFGLVVGALLAKEIAKKVQGVDYRLLIATAYSGMLVWHGGVSGSIPLTMAGTSGEALAAQTAGAVTASIPTSLTIFSNFNLTISALLLVLIPLTALAMMPSKEETVVVDPALIVDVEAKKIEINTPADKLENSRILWVIILALGLGYLVWHFATKGAALDLNVVNMIFLFVGLLLHGNIRRYIDAIMDAAKSAGGILLQFPFYAGIMGMMTGGHAVTGLSLAGVISNAFVSIATATTFPLFSFLSAGIVNFFVPSGGGQWAVQAPIMMPAGAALKVPEAVTAMSIAWGDAWTNMIQPFWALPALGIAGLSAKDIMGFCLMMLIMSGIVICGVFFLFPMLGLI